MTDVILESARRVCDVEKPGAWDIFFSGGLWGVRSISSRDVFFMN